ncbi:hypothetical protein MHYP_G00271970 [Metynnis hypsauchen]
MHFSNDSTRARWNPLRSNGYREIQRHDCELNHTWRKCRYSDALDDPLHSPLCSHNYTSKYDAATLNKKGEQVPIITCLCLLAEDRERWAMCFDSYQRQVPLHPPAVPASGGGEPDMGSSLSHRRHSKELCLQPGRHLEGTVWAKPVLSTQLQVGCCKVAIFKLQV